MRLRAARAADLEALVAFEDTVFADDPHRIVRRQWQALLRQPGAVIVAAAPGELLGVIVLALRGRVLRIQSIGVAAAARRRGVGATLLELAARRGRRLGCSAVRLEVAAGNQPARALYAAHGFLEVDCLPGYYGRGRDGLRLELRLSPPAAGSARRSRRTARAGSP